MKRNVKLRFGGSVSLQSGKWALRLIPVLGLLFSASTLRAAVNLGGVKFNKDVKYSQWAINSRLYDFRGNQKKFGFAKWDANTQKIGTYPEWDGKNGVRLDYVAGLVGKATIEASEYYDTDWSKPWFESAKDFAVNKNTYTAKTNASDLTLDNMNAAKMFIPLTKSEWTTLAEKTKAEKYINEVIEDMVTYNSTLFIGSAYKGSYTGIDANTAKGLGMFGAWYHKPAYIDQTWCDGMYMGPALLAQIVKYNGNTNNLSKTESDWDILARQFTISWKQLYNESTGLLYHGFTANPGDNASKDWSGITAGGTTYHSASFWGRANSWYLMALVDVLEVMPKDNNNYATLRDYLDKLAVGIAKHQDKTTGCWYQLLDKDASFSSNGKSNYLEASCSSIFTAAYLKAIRLGLLDKTTYEPVAMKAYEGLVNQFMVYDNTDNNTIQLVKSCTSAGLGGSDKRAGDDNYYLTGKDAGVVTSATIGNTYYYTEGKVLGGFIMAATEYERAYQNQDSKQILFAKDLAPQYDFSTTAGSLDATAYGTGAEKATYQWYKDGNAVDKATSATYTPTESGKYYCTATVGNNTIQTSTTTVTAATEGGNTPATPTGTTAVYEWGTLTGTTTLNGGVEDGSYKLNGVSNVKALKFGSNYNFKNGKYMTIGSGFKKGDVITLTGYADTPSQAIGVYSAKDGSNITTINLSESSKTYVTRTYTLEADYETLLIGRAAGSTTYITALKVERKKALTATFASNNVTATVGDASVTVPNLTVKAGETTLALSTDYTVSYSSDKEGVVRVDNGTTLVPVATGDAVITATIIPVDKTKYNETTAKFTVNVKEAVTPKPTGTTTVYDFNTTVGTTTSYASSVSYDTNNTKMTFGSDFRINEQKYISITPKDGSNGFKAGDIITLKGFCDSKNPSGIVIYNSIAAGAESIFKTNTLAKSEDGGSEYTFTLTSDCETLYFGRFGGGNTYLTSLNVVRPATTEGKTRLTASFEKSSDVVISTMKTVNLPALIVEAGDMTLKNEQYNVDYSSNATSVATVSGNSISIVGTGTATITAKITPAGDVASKYEGTTATYQITVKDPTPLNITVQDVTINVTDADYKQPVINVYGDNDKLLKLGTDYTLEFTKDGTNVNVENGTFKPVGEKYNWTKGTTVFHVTAKPTESLGNTYTDGTLDFSYNVIEGKLKPTFLSSFSGRTIKLHKDANNREFTVPLIYDYEDVSDYFDYTYTIGGITGTLKKENNENTHTLLYAPNAEGQFKVVVTAKPKTGNKEDGSDDYSQVYETPESITFTLDVKDTYRRVNIALDPEEIDLYTGTSDGAPDVTVTYADGDKSVVPDSEIADITWSTNNESFARINAETGHIEAVSEGEALGRCLVVGNNIESTTKFFVIKVDDPAKYRVKKSGEYKNQTVMWNQDNTLSVTLGGWMFPENIDKTIYSSEGLRNTYVWGGDKQTSSLATWSINGEQYLVSGERQKNARQENGANALPESTKIYSADFKTTINDIKDQMFNVPCSGSYLVFNPKTTGVVSVDILQNGAFDKDTKNGTTVYQYRPQRRVFVMDESGNIVETGATIGNANGKPLGKGNDRFNLSNYTWDLTDEKPTEALVNSHFTGLENFELSESGFKNNVYCSSIPQDIIPNQAALNHPKMASANGWAVLADAPVTYTFRVQPGKTYYLYNFGSKIGFYGYSFEEDENAPVVDNIEYKEEADNNQVTSTPDGHVATVKIDRKFTAGVWSTCVLPFSLNKQQVDAIFGETYSATATNGTEILYFDRVDENGKVWFVRHAYNTIVANKPFLIKPTKDVNGINTADCVEYPYVIIEAPENNKPADWCSDGKYAWVSSYNNDMTLSTGDGYIGGTSGNFIQSNRDGVKVKGFRGFLKGLTPAAKTHVLSTMTASNTDGDGNTTFIDGLVVDGDGNFVPTATDGKVYSINGQLVGKDMKSLGSLPSGIYIINGKKYIK